MTTVLDWTTTHLPRPQVLSVNIPDVSPHELRELRSARLAAFGAVTTTVTSIEQGSVLLDYPPAVGDAAEGTDVALLRLGHPTVTALNPMAEAGTPEGLLTEFARVNTL